MRKYLSSFLFGALILFLVGCQSIDDQRPIIEQWGLGRHETRMGQRYSDRTPRGKDRYILADEVIRSVVHYGNRSLLVIFDD